MAGINVLSGGPFRKKQTDVSFLRVEFAFIITNLRRLRKEISRQCKNDAVYIEMGKATVRFDRRLLWQRRAVFRMALVFLLLDRSFAKPSPDVI